MRRKAKQLSAFLLVLAMAVSLAACNKPDQIWTQPSFGESTPAVSRNQVFTIGAHTLRADELNYFYIDAINTYCNQYGYYISFLIDTKSPLNSESNTDADGITWADKFLDMAIENIKSTYQLYDLATESGFQLSEKDQKSIEDTMANLETNAKYYGYTNADPYLRAIYGKGADESSYRAYLEICTIAESYYNTYAASLKYDDADLRSYEEDKYWQYSSYNYAYYYLNVSTFLKGGVKDNEGNVSYTDEEKAAAVNAAKDLAEQLASGHYGDTENFDNAINTLLNTYWGTTGTRYASTKNEDVLYGSINNAHKEWLIGIENDDNGNQTQVIRKEGDMAVIAYASGSGENKAITGFYVLRFGSASDNNFLLKNVRHLLVAYKGGTTDAYGNKVYTDAEKNAAKEQAMQLLAAFQSTNLSEESFAMLADQHSDDGNATTGGLYEDIYPGQMVAPFEEWCYDSQRKVGDFGLVQTVYGWHIMYYVGESQQTYRDYLITEDLRMEELMQWIADLEESADWELLTDKYVDLAYVINPS